MHNVKLFLGPRWLNYVRTHQCVTCQICELLKFSKLNMDTLNRHFYSALPNFDY